MSPAFFIARPKFAFVISILITIAGLLSLAVMPIDQYPDITAPKIVVRAVYPGASADTVRNTVAAVIEKEVNGAEGMVYMSSQSASDGSYVLTVTFDIDVNDDMAQVDVQNRVALAEPGLPAEVRQRGIRVRKRSPDILMVVNLLSPDERFDRVFLSNFAKLNVEAELGRLPGVGEASILGALDYGMRVWLQPVTLANYNLTVNDVIAALQEQNVQAAVGQLGAAPTPQDTQFQYVLTTQGRLSDEKEFGDIILRAEEGGSVVRLSDVARIELGAEVYKGYGEFNNGPGVILTVYKLSDANALETAQLVRDKMDELSAFFPEGIEYTIGHDTTLFIEASIHEVVLTLFFTIALVVLVTYIFLGNYRATLVPTLAIPVSVIGTFAVLYALGMTINTVTLFALILSIGVVVDDAIVVVENVERLIHEGMDRVSATRQAMKEVTGPIVATSLVLVAVFGPTMLLPGMTGRMFGQFGTTLVVSVLISTINSLTLSPALCASVLHDSAGYRPNILIRGFNKGFGRIAGWYTSFVAWLVKLPLLAVAIIAVLFVTLGFLFTMTPSSFVPEEDKGFFMVDVQLPDAAALVRTERAMDVIVETLKADPNIENVLSVNGFSIVNGAMQSNAGMIIVKLNEWGERTAPGQDQFSLQRKYQSALANLTEARVLVFGAPALPGLGIISGFSFMLEDTVGRGPGPLAQSATLLAEAATARPEIARAWHTFRPSTPQIELVVDRTRAKTLGVTVSDIFLTLQTELGGFYVNDFNLFSQTYKVMVQAEAADRLDERDLAKYYVRNRDGEMVPISAVVTSGPSAGPDVIYRYNTYDSAKITGIPNEVGGYSSGEAMAAMEDVAAATMPGGYKYEWTDSSFEERESGNLAPIAFGLSLLFTFLFLVALYESWLTPFAIILSVPIGILGALVALLVAGEPLSLYGQIGLVLLVGLASKSAILIVEFGKQLREAEGLGLVEATVTSARLRFRPVLMTGLSFVVGVFPLVIASGAGAAGRISMGLAVFGGMIMAAIAGTLLVPIFFYLVQSLRERFSRP